LPPQEERVPGLTEGESRHAINGQALVIDGRSGIAQGLLEILGFEKGILGDQGRSVRISRKKFEDAANGDPHPADARLAAALPRLNCNSVKLIYRCHMLSLEHQHPLADQTGHKSDGLLSSKVHL
jgi:hypothetical protein